MRRWWPFLNTILFKTQWHLTQKFLRSRILPTVLSRIPWGILNGTRCPKSQPAILDQTIFKLRICKLKTFSYKVQCSKGIIFMVIASTQTRGSVLHSHRLDKICLSLYLKKNNHPGRKHTCYSQPSPTSHTTQHKDYHRILGGQGALSIQASFHTMGLTQMTSGICSQNLVDLY